MLQGCSIRELEEEEFWKLFGECKQDLADDWHSYSLQDMLSEPELVKLEALGKGLGAPYKLFLGVFDKQNQFIGWSWGVQQSASIFYMTNSGILKEHQNKGLYGAVLERCIAILSEKGFQLIYSRHCATNNAVIIPKLRAGFIISKMEIDDKFGVLIHLHFYTNRDRRKIMDYRSGLAKPDQRIREILKIS